MTEIYVSLTGKDTDKGTAEQPLATLTEALSRAKVAAEECWDGPVTIYLKGGVYRLTAPVKLSFRAPLTIKSAPGEEAVLDGGRVLTGLAETEYNGMRCWTVKTTEKDTFNALFVNGERRQRAYLPKKGFYRIESVPGQELKMPYRTPGIEFIADTAMPLPTRNVNDAIIHLFHYWSDEQIPVKSVDGRLVTMSQYSCYALHDESKTCYCKYRLENSKDCLTEPGDWYIDREEGLFYYLPYENETLENSELTVPALYQLLVLKDCADVRLENLTFQNTDWDTALLNVTGQGASQLTGAIRFESSVRCALTGCKLRHIGYYCVDVANGSSNIEISRNELTDMCAGGIKINGASFPEPREGQVHHVRVTDNLIAHGGREFLAGIGVLSMHAHDVTVAHNEIFDLYYTGISVGWVWGYKESVSYNNIIEYNHIYDIGHGVLSDMGGIYLLGVAPGTVVRNNLVHDIEKANYGGWAIYPDEGSSHLVIENNIGYNTSSSCFHQHYGRENTVRNNIWAFGSEGIIAYTRLEDHVGFTFERNIVLTDGQVVYTDPGIGCIKADMNLFWDVNGAPVMMGDFRDKASFHPVEDMKQKGNDLFSLVADPLFKDAKNGDFTLDEDSPAFLLGFQPIDMSTVGIRK